MVQEAISLQTIEIKGQLEFSGIMTEKKMLIRGRQCIDFGDYEEAEEYLSSYTDLDPENGEGWRLRTISTLMLAKTAMDKYSEHWFVSDSEEKTFKKKIKFLGEASKKHLQLALRYLPSESKIEIAKFYINNIPSYEHDPDKYKEYFLNYDEIIRACIKNGVDPRKNEPRNIFPASKIAIRLSKYEEELQRKRDQELLRQSWIEHGRCQYCGGRLSIFQHICRSCKKQN
jgi:tetratricopeptide (TPR) repeat protein